MQHRDRHPAVTWQPEGPGMDRPRLMERLMQARHRRCVVLQGPAGSGKTSLLLAWRRQLVVAGADVAWLALDGADDDLDRFFESLLAGLRAVNPALVREAEVMAYRGTAAERAEVMVIALVRAIGAHARPLVLVFDDAHHLRDLSVTAALQLLLDYGPAQLLCALGTRSEPPLALGRLRSQGQLLELGLDDLRFTPDESAELATRLLGAVDVRQAQALHTRTDGWAAGLKLLCLDLRYARASRRPAQTGVRDANTFTSYLEQEVLAYLSSDDLAALVHCAIVEHFDAVLVAALSGDSSTRVTLLTPQDHQSLFLIPAGPRFPFGWWRMHPLLRDVLLARLNSLPPERLKALHVVAFQYFAAHQMIHEAVYHALRGGDIKGAADLTEASATRLFTRGELRLLAGVVQQLPEQVVSERSGLRLWLAYALLYALRLDECAISIRQLVPELRSATPVERYRLTLLRALLAVQQDNFAAAIELLDELLDAPPDADGIALSGQRNLLTWIYLYRGEYDRARQVQFDQSAPLVDGQPVHGTMLGILAGRCLAGLTHAVQGQMILAERIYRDVLYETEKQGVACADVGTLAAGLLGEVLYELNDAAGALALLEPRLDVLEQVSIPDTAVRVMLTMCRSRWLAGRPLDALDGLEQAQEHAERSGLDRVLAYCFLEQLQFRLMRRELSAARVAMEGLQTLDARHAGTDTGVMSEIRMAANRGRIRIAMYTGEMDQALTMLESLTRLCQLHGRARRVPYLLLQSAAVERELGRHKAAQSRVREALRLGHNLGLVRSMLDAHQDVPSLLQEAQRDPTLDPVLLFYAERLEAAVRDTALGAPVRIASARPGLEVLSPREAEIVRVLLQAQPNKKIARALDLSLNTVKWHLKNIYTKLGVSGRDQVVERLRD